MKNKGNYNTLPYKFGSLMTVTEFMEYCDEGGFIDYDGSGHPVKDNMMDLTDIYPSERLETIPKDATHILWFNK